MTVADGSEPERLGLRYLVLAQQVRKVLDKHMVSNGLSLARWKVLEVLDGTGSIRQTALAQELGFAPRSVHSGGREPGERRACRTQARSGRRSGPKLVALTDEGAAALAAGTKAGRTHAPADLRHPRPQAAGTFGRNPQRHRRHHSGTELGPPARSSPKVMRPARTAILPGRVRRVSEIREVPQRCYSAEVPHY